MQTRKYEFEGSNSQLVHHVVEGSKYDGFTRTSCPGSIIYNMYTGADINLQQQWLKKTSGSIRSKKNHTHGINKGDKSQCIISLTWNKYIMSHIWLMLWKQFSIPFRIIELEEILLWGWSPTISENRAELGIFLKSTVNVQSLNIETKLNTRGIFLTSLI